MSIIIPEWCSRRFVARQTFRHCSTVSTARIRGHRQSVDSYDDDVDDDGGGGYLRENARTSS